MRGTPSAASDRDARAVHRSRWFCAAKEQREAGTARAQVYAMKLRLAPDLLLLSCVGLLAACQQTPQSSEETVPDARADAIPHLDGLAESQDGRVIDASAEQDSATVTDQDAEARTDSPTGAFADVQAIFDGRCVICHDAQKLGLPSDPALPLTAGAAYDALVNRPALETCGGTLVVPGQPEQSYLFRKVVDTTPCFGLRMPHPFESLIMVPLTAAQLATIRTWIERGALR
jgi:mono/diheme cytochrome c family protein